MSIASNRISGSSMWGMTTDHTVMMLRDPDVHALPGVAIPVYLTGDEVDVAVTSDEVIVRRA